jgi:tetratricopeptide (TPR) repeat protein
MAPPPPRAPAPDPVAAEPRADRAALAERRRAVRITRDRDHPLASETEGSNALEQREAWPPQGAPPALEGELAEIMRAPRSDVALAKARAWHLKDPGDVLALIGLGEVLEARGDLDAAARMYGSIIDLFPGRADLRRFAGERLERIGDRARPLAIDTYRRAVADRPDHATGHRLLAYALLRAGRHAEALAAILTGLEQKYPSDRFRGAERILAEDAGLIGAAYAAAAPGKRAEIAAVLGKHRLAIAAGPSTRFVLYWETDANDVDFHIQDARGGHAWYSSKRLPSGGELFEDVTTGYGPECFAIPGTAKAGPYRLSLDYYSQGPMGYGMGLLQIVRHDGQGKLSFEDRPFVIMNDHAYVDLGSYR